MDRKLQFGPNSQIDNKQYRYPTNFIVTSRYNIITFLPFSLFIQFSRMANCYFLLIAILSCFPVISPYSPLSSFTPLIFVVCLSMVRDAYEDYQRHKSDNELNASPVTIWTQEGFINKTWKDVQVGDIIKVEEMEIMSADLVVLQTALGGPCFIETSSLDGEKNLKPKQAIQETQNKESKVGTIHCIQPNPLLYNFDGILYLNEQKISINHKHFVLRGSRLKNCKWLLGAVVYTGVDTKVMKNSDTQKNKISNIDSLVNTRIIYILLIQLICCLVVAIIFMINCMIGDTNFTFFNENYNGYNGNPPSCGANTAITFASYFLLLNTLIPISLIVSLEFVKVAQAHFMQRDKEMYCAENDKFLKVFSCTINEELGQVQYIFTDKTGTLTCNKMEFKILVVGTEIYGDKSIFKKQDETTYVGNQAQRRRGTLSSRRGSFVDSKAGIEYNFESNINQIINEKKDKQVNPDIELLINNYTIKNQGDLIKETLILLATCHECVLEENEDGTFNYQGPSPDEIALVDAARRLKYAYKGIKQGQMEIDMDGKTEYIELLNSFEFNSDRKRMSVIIKHNGLYKLYSKGADSIIKARLSQNQLYLAKIDEQLDFFSRKGLRTLCLAMKILEEKEYNDFRTKMNQTLGNDNAEKLQNQLIDQMEQQMTLLGATAVEDQLQEDVPETLADFLKANINVWMLTGDKLETAENIGRSCNLLQENMEVFYITPQSDIPKTMSQIADHIKHKKDQKRAVLIEGLAIAIIEMNQNMKNFLILLAPHMHSVICCRVTPKQKADMVRLVKNNLNKITLAVGDGANDVNMIMEANIGVGIYGQEGMRAVQSSNFAIGQFKCLWKLILYHGRLNYIRISEMILYFFYKNIIFTVPQLYFGFFCSYTGSSVFNDYYVTLYNTVFTFWPVVIRAIFDEDIYYMSKRKSTLTGSRRASVTDYESQNDILRQNYPKLYYIGQKNTIFTNERFFKWFSIGVIQGFICFFSFYFEISGTTITSEGGYTGDIWFFSIAIFTSIMILVTLKLALNTQFWTLITWIAYLVTSLGSYFGYVFLSSAIPMSQVYMTSGQLFTSSIFYLSLALSVLSMFVFDLMLFTIKSTKKTLLNYMKQQSRTSSQMELEKIQQLDQELKSQYSQEYELQNYDLQSKRQQLQESLQSENNQQQDQII